MSAHPFQPDYAVAPGKTLKETLEAKGISQTDLARRTGLTTKTISQIINGVAPITQDTGAKLELVTGVPATTWNRLELRYRETLAQKDLSARFESESAWLKELPLKTLIEQGHLSDRKDKALMVRQALSFFGVSSVDAWRNTWQAPVAQYRGGAIQEQRPGYVAAWLRMGEKQAEGRETAPFSKTGFKSALQHVRQLTTSDPATWLDELTRLCAPVGVTVVLTKQIPRAGISGATRWLTKDQALLQLSLKYKSDDQFWFTFFHEAGHILLHGKKALYLETPTSGTTNDEEEEANAFARDLLIPPKHSPRLPMLRSKAAIRQFAREIGIAPGIVVGRLQKDRILGHDSRNDLKIWIDHAE